MNKPYGLSAEIQGYPWPDLKEEFEVEGVTIKIEAGNIEIGYNDELDEAKARRLADLYLHSYSLRSGFKIAADFNHSWKPAPTGGTAHALNISDEIKVAERLQVSLHQATITGTARIVNQEAHDSASLTNDTSLVLKAMSHPVLERALSYFGTEVVDDKKPLYGVYKAIEAITSDFGKDGRENLAKLLSENKAYVSDLLETTQLERHAVTPARKLLSDKECVNRAKLLVQAYADSLPNN